MGISVSQLQLWRQSLPQSSSVTSPDQEPLPCTSAKCKQTIDGLNLEIVNLKESVKRYEKNRVHLMTLIQEYDDTIATYVEYMKNEEKDKEKKDDTNAR